MIFAAFDVGRLAGGGSHGRTVLLDQIQGGGNDRTGIAGGRANGGWGMSIDKGHPLLGQPVQMGGGNLRLGVEGLGVPVTHVVGESQWRSASIHRKQRKQEGMIFMNGKTKTKQSLSRTYFHFRLFHGTISTNST